MNREIKFRGMTTNLVKNEFVYGYYQKVIGYGPNDSDEEYHLIVNENDESDYIDGNTVGQFTGLKDKNGVDIYENDIVKIINALVKDDTFTVEWSDGKEFGIGFGLFSCFEYEIVGNINEVKK